MAKYAEGTEVPVARSRQEIDTILERYGASGRGTMVDDDANLAIVMFRLHDRHIRIKIALPNPQEARFRLDRYGNVQTPKAAQTAYEKELRRVWRVLVLQFEAKLEATADDPATFEHEFLADILLPTGETVGEASRAAIDEAYRTGRMPPLLPGMGPRALPPGKEDQGT